MQNYTNKYILPSLFLLTCIFSACGGRKNTPDVSHIPIQVKIERFDEQFFKTDTNNVQGALKLLDQSFPGFLSGYFRHILNFGPYSDTATYIAPQVLAFITNKDFRALQDSITKKFKDITPVERELTQAFRLTKYYIPRFKAPRVVAFMSAIGNYGAVTIDTIVGLGLDMHMGADFSIYKLIPDYPDYIVRRFTPENIPVNVMKVIEQDYFPPHADGAKLIEQLVDLGRQQYFLEMVLPETPEEYRLGYTKAQLDYCNENELMIWQYFVQNKLLYTTDYQDIMRYIGEGPSTQGLPGEAPGQIGAFTGYRIVQQYMKKHPEVTLEQLMTDKDAAGIFSKAKYRP